MTQTGTEEFWNSLSKSFEENVESAGLDENGELQLRMVNQEPATPGGATPNRADSPDAPSSESTPAPDERMAALEKRVTDMQAWGTKLATENAKLRNDLARTEGRLEGSGQPGSQDGGEQQPQGFDVAAFNEDPAGYLDSFIESRVTDRLTDLWEPLLPDFQHLRTQRETAEFLAGNSDALNYWDRMVELNSTLPPKSNMTLTELYEAAKELYPEGSGKQEVTDPNQQDSPEPPKPSHTDEADRAIRERIARLRTEAPSPAMDLDSLPAVNPDAGVGRNPTIDEAMALAAASMPTDG